MGPILRKLQDLEWLIWIVSALVAIGVAYGTLASADTAFEERINNHERVQFQTNQDIQRQLDRIEQRVISIEEHLRNGQQYGPH